MKGYMQNMMENKFYKVSHDGGTLVTGMFFNPITMEEKSEVLRDYEYSDCRRDNDELYYMEIDEEVKRIWKHHHGAILEGDVVEVVKGRKIPIGYIGTVRKIYPYHDRYGRWVADYVYFTDGQKTNIDNCILKIAY